MNNIKEVIRQKIVVSPDQSLQARARIYRAALDVVDNYPEANREIYRQQLKEIILGIESEFSDLLSVQDAQTDVQTPKNEVAFAPDVLRKPWSSFSPANKTLMGWPGLGVLALIFAIGSLVFLFVAYTNRGEFVEIDNNETNASVENQLPVQAVDEPILDLDFSSKPNEAAEELSTRVIREGFGTAKLRELLQDNGLTVTEELVFYAGPVLEVDTSRIYSMQVEILKSSVADYRPEIGIGFVTFNDAGRIQRAAPGPFRNFAHHGKFRASETLAVEDRWVISGVITGEGNQSHNHFRVGTKTVRAVLKISPEPGKPVTVSRITLKPLT